MIKTSQNNKITLVYSPKYSEIPFVKNAGQNRQLLKSHVSWTPCSRYFWCCSTIHIKTVGAAHYGVLYA